MTIMANCVERWTTSAILCSTLVLATADRAAVGVGREHRYAEGAVAMSTSVGFSTRIASAGERPTR